MATRTRNLSSLNAIRTFDAVARHRSFTLGAEELGVTQSAVSHQMRKLEEDLDTSLFDRKGRALVLTPAGETLWAAVHDGLTTIARAIDMVRANRLNRPFGLHVRPHFALKWLAPRLVRLWERHPNFDLRLQHSVLPADFHDRSIDLAIEWLHADDIKAGASLLLQGNLTPACHPSLLQQREGVIEPSDLVDFALLHEADEESWRAWLAAASVPDLMAARNHYYDDANVRHEAAIRGEGMALVCPSLAQEEIATGVLVCPFDIHLDSYAYYIVSPPHSVESLAARTVKTWLLDEVRKDA